MFHDIGINAVHTSRIRFQQGIGVSGTRQ
jgi:hypothetical protein